MSEWFFFFFFFWREPAENQFTGNTCTIIITSAGNWLFSLIKYCLISRLLEFRLQNLGFDVFILVLFFIIFAVRGYSAYRYCGGYLITVVLNSKFFHSFLFCSSIVSTVFRFFVFFILFFILLINVGIWIFIQDTIIIDIIFDLSVLYVCGTNSRIQQINETDWVNKNCFNALGLYLFCCLGFV